MVVHPLIFQPLFKPRLWGGRVLGELFGKALPVDQPIGESWELVDLPEDKSVVADGPMKGRSIDQLIEQWGPALLGRAALIDGSFPLLIKFLDAAADLSVQVHPDAEMVRRLGGHLRVKHEAWYVLAAQPGAVIYKGLCSGVTREQFVSAVEQGACAELLNRVPVKVGDCHYLPSGTVHALGAGVVVAEVQTPSDVTFRIFDWNRTDPATGRPRELHVQQAMECIHFGPPDETAQRRSHLGSQWTTVTRLVKCESFVIEKVRMSAGIQQPIPYAEPVVWIVIQGSGRIRYGPTDMELQFKPGDVLLLPAALEQSRVAVDDDSVWLEVTIPAPSDLAGFPHPSAEQLQAPPGSALSPVQINIRR